MVYGNTANAILADFSLIIARYRRITDPKTGENKISQ